MTGLPANRELEEQHKLMRTGARLEASIKSLRGICSNGFASRCKRARSRSWVGDLHIFLPDLCWRFLSGMRSDLIHDSKNELAILLLKI